MTKLAPFNFRQTGFPSLGSRYDYNRVTSGRDYDWNPIAGFRREIDRLFDEFAGVPAFTGFEFDRSSGYWPSLDIRESDDEVTVTAELPGMTEKDLELYFEKDMLTLRGFKRADKDEPGYSERFYGRFERQVPLPYSVDPEHCTAEFRDGLLLVRFQKLAEADNKKKIPIKTTSVKAEQGTKQVASERRTSAFADA